MTQGILLAIIAIIATSAGQVLLKAGTNARVILILSAYGCFAVATGLGLIALRTIPLSLYTSWSASTYIIVGLFSRIFLDERPTLRQWSGLCAVFAGIVIFSLA